MTETFHFTEVSIPEAAAREELAAESEPPRSWLAGNIVNPVVNAIAIDPYKAVSGAVNFTTDNVFGKKFLPRVNHLAVADNTFMGPSWMVQNIASGLAMAVPYAIAGKGAGSLLGFYGKNWGARGVTAAALKNPHVAQIVGSMAYDGLRETNPGETHIGNALGGGVGFGAFELGNAMSSRFGITGRIFSRMATGAVGSTLQHSTAHLYSTGEIPDGQTLAKGAMTGAFMNLALPATQKGLVKAVDLANVRFNRGIPVDRYVQNHGDWARGSSYLSSLIWMNPWARVQPGEHNVARGSNKIELNLSDAGKLAHELEHLSQHGTSEARYSDIAEKVKTGDVNGAWRDYFNLRKSHETAADAAENVINRQLHSDTAADTTPIAKRIASNGRTYEQIWQEEFGQFVLTGGKFRPTEDFARSQNGRHSSGDDASLWQRRSSQWETLGPEEKIVALKELAGQPPVIQTGVWYNALKDGNNHVRFTAIDNITSLPQSQRLPAWLAAVRHSDYPTRMLALSKLGLLPAEQRFDAFKAALVQHRVTLAKPGQGEKNPVHDLIYNKEYEKYKARLEKTPEQLLVDAIPTLNRSRRFEAWQQLLQNKETRKAASDRLDVVPDDARLDAWQRVLSSGHDGNVNSALRQMNLLHETDRLQAWEKVKATPDALRRAEPSELAAAFKALPLADAEKFSEWQSLLKQLNEHETERANEGRERRFGYSYTYRRAASYFPPIQRPTLIGAIEGLPENHRTKAFLEAVSTLGSKSANEYADVVKHLPSSDRAAAWALVFEADPKNRYMGWKMAASDVPVKDLPQVAESLMKSSISDPETRADLIRDFPLYSLLEVPLAERLPITQKIFETGLGNARAQDYEALRNWWAELPDKYDDAGFVQETHVRQHLVNNVEVTQLAKLLFNADDAEVGNQFARSNPQVVRKLLSQLEWIGDEQSARELGVAASKWNETGSLNETVKAALEAAQPRTEKYADPSKLPQLAGILAEHASNSEKAATLKQITAMLLTHGTTEFSIETAVSTAVRIGSHDPQLLQTHFVVPMERALRDSGNDYSWRLRTARAIATAARENTAGDVQIKLPQLRMPPAELSPELQQTYRQQAEAALLGEGDLPALLGDGPLGKIYPRVFGFFESDGGIVGRPQHGGHEFTVDVHTGKVLTAIRNHPDFHKLPVKDRLNLLWAALLHDVGKRAGREDPDHEWASANMSWGVLHGLGYSSIRTNRIANLISRHGEASYAPHKPSTRFDNVDAAADLAAFYRHPNALQQLRIFNEADIRSIDGQSKLWKPDVEAELDRITSLLAPQVRVLNKNAIPILTTELPNKFGLFPMNQDYAVLAHASSHMDSSFLHQLSVIETPEYSASTSLLRPGHYELYRETPIVALITAPPEQISQAHRENLSTGTAVDWNGHVRLAKDWSTRDKANELTAELDSRLRNGGGVGRSGIGLATLRNRLAQFESLDEVGRTLGTNSSEYRGALEIVRVLTTDAAGNPLKIHNEIKVNNPTVSGLGIIRRGKPVVLENFSTEDVGALTTTGALPSWFSPVPLSPDKAVVVPQIVWQEALRRNMPLVVLDP